MRDSDADARIADRIRAIYAAIDGLLGVEVSVREGVVLLSGNVEWADAALQAEPSRQRRGRGACGQCHPPRSRGGPHDQFDRRFVREPGHAACACPSLGVAILVALGVVALSRWLAAWQALWRWFAPNPFVAEVAASAVRFAGILAGLNFALEMFGATALLGAFPGVGGLIGIAIGFAVRDTIDNHISSIMLSVCQHEGR